jgi:hypothetical protein
MKGSEIENFAAGLLPEKCFKSEEQIKILHFGSTRAKQDGILNLRQISKFSSPAYEKIC